MVPNRVILDQADRLPYDMTQTKLRDIDHAILKHIEEGRNDTQKITQATTLKTHQVRYSLKKLEQQGLIKLEKPEGTVERVINGQKRVFQAPHKAELTDKAIEFLEQAQVAEEGRFQDLTREELIERMKVLEREVEDLQNSFEVFRKQVQQRLD